MLRRRVVVHGRVQGVWFRSSVQDRALALGVAGWVSNRCDGAVEAVFEGDEAAIDELVRYCRRGPSDARVDRVEIADEPPTGEVGFQVR